MCSVKQTLNKVAKELQLKCIILPPPPKKKPGSCARPGADNEKTTTKCDRQQMQQG